MTPTRATRISANSKNGAAAIGGRSGGASRRAVEALASAASGDDGRPTTWRKLILAGLAHGLLFTLAFPPYNLWPLAYVALVPLALIALRTTSRGRAFLCVWLTATLFWLWIQRWLIDVTWQGYPLLAMYHALYPASFVWILSRLRPRGGRPVIPALTNALLVPLVWVALEAIRGAALGSGAYPWFFIGHPLIGAPILCQTADLFGSYAVSFLAAMPAGLLADFLTLPLLRNGRLAPTLRLWLIVFLVIQIAALAYGAVRLYDTTPMTRDQPSLTLAAVQTNIEQSNKLQWSIEDQRSSLSRFIEMTERAVDGPRPDSQPEVELVIWPETMAPGAGLNDEAQAAIERIEQETGKFWPLPTREILSNLARDLATPILVGAHAAPNLTIEVVDGKLDIDSPGQHNSAFLFLPSGELSPERYDKLVLTPFGELIPYVYRWPDIQQWFLDLGAHGLSFDLAAGSEVQTISTPQKDGERDFVLATPICFESTAPALCRRLIWTNGRKTADALINLTNDGWFGDYLGGREQHVMVGRFRCIENRVPMARAANTGISAAIDSAGRLIQYGPKYPDDSPIWNAEGLMIATLYSDPRWTLYGTIGDSFAWVCLGIAATLLVVSIARGRRPRNEKELP